jgi:hypothetical protein
MKLATASEHVCMEIRERVTLDFYKEDIRLSEEFLVVPNLSEEVVIGATTTQKWRIKLDFEHNTIVIDPKVAKLILINLIKKKINWIFAAFAWYFILIHMLFHRNFTYWIDNRKWNYIFLLATLELSIYF